MHVCFGSNLFGFSNDLGLEYLADVQYVLSQRRCPTIYTNVSVCLILLAERKMSLIQKDVRHFVKTYYLNLVFSVSELKSSYYEK